MAPTSQDLTTLKREILEDQARAASFAIQLESRLTGPNGPITDHEERLRTVEKWQWRMMGAGLCAGFFITIFVGVATSMIADDIRQLREKLVTPGKR